VILPSVSRGPKSSTLTVRDEYELGKFVCRALRRIFEPEGKEETEDYRNNITSFMIYTL
jgi:hypothetical protein